MTPETARKFLQTYEGKRDVLSFVKPSHLEELSPLLECHIEAVTVCKGEFHELESGKTYMPRKETLDKFAGAAGVSYNEQAERTWKEGDTCYVGRSQAMVMGPDGKMIFGDVCEYEFDAEVRTEEMKLNGKSDYKDGRYTGKRDLTDKELASERIQFMKVGRQRANTGARSRGTLSALGMQTGFKELFSKTGFRDSPNEMQKIVIEQLGWAERVSFWTPCDTDFFEGLQKEWEQKLITSPHVGTEQEKIGSSMSVN